MRHRLHVDDDRGPRRRHRPESGPVRRDLRNSSGVAGGNPKRGPDTHDTPGWVPESLRPSVQSLPELRRLGAETFTRQFGPAWLRRAILAGATRIIWRPILNVAHDTGTLAATTTAFFVAYEETSRRSALTVRAVAGAVAPFFLLTALGLVGGALLPSPWAAVSHGAVVVVGVFVGLVLAASQSHSSTLPELVRMRRSRRLRRQGVSTWTAAGLAGPGGIALAISAKEHLPPSGYLTVTARDEQAARAYRRWLVPIEYPRWLSRPDPPRALEGETRGSAQRVPTARARP